MSYILPSKDRARPVNWPAKDPTEALIYGIDFYDRLGTDTISTVDFSLTTAAGLTLSAPQYSGTIASVTVSDGTEGSKGKILCAVTTNNGQRLEQTATLLVRSR